METKTYRLYVVESDDEGLKGERYELTQDRYAFGRATGCCGYDAKGYECIYVLSEGISRVHATLERRDGRWWVADAGSTQGTLVRGQRVDAARAIEPGDRFTLFRTTFELREG
jgi:hypothetical protein